MKDEEIQSRMQRHFLFPIFFGVDVKADKFKVDYFDVDTSNTTKWCRMFDIKVDKIDTRTKN